jgi:signal transduction histidine kinase
VKALRGQTREAGSFDDEAFRESDFLARTVSLKRAHFEYFARRAIAAAIFGDTRGLGGLVERAASLNQLSPGLGSTPNYQAAWVQWMGVLGLAWRWREDGVGPGEEQRAAAQRAIEWLAARAQDAAQNFHHLHLHACAELAWAGSDVERAGALFDEALCAAEQAARPWHRALITECAARFEAARGRRLHARALLFEAHRLYDTWGAGGKAAQLRQELGVVPRGDAAPTLAQRQPASEVDTIALLRAAQVLGSERDIARLRARVEEILSSVTGARRVTVAMWDEEADDWMVHDARGERLRASQAGHLLPLSALRYVERTGEVLLLADAVGDDRFSRDPYLREAIACSLMVVPIRRKGSALATIILENRASRGAFSTAALDAVTVIAGQLAVSLENALLYESLEHKVNEQTQQLRDAQSKLLPEARRAGMSQIATNVLHNVGNVLTSVNVSARVLDDRVRGSHASRLADLVQLLEGKSQAELGRFFADDPRGRMIPVYLGELEKTLREERGELLAELDRLRASIEHINNVVAMQQGYAGPTGVLESMRLTDLVDDALRMHEDALRQAGVRTSRDYSSVRPADLDKTRVMQILINLIENARHAVDARAEGREITVRVGENGHTLSVSVTDNGCGIAQTDIARIFSHGFTTKSGGHGFGLHSCAIAAREMGGNLEVRSDGPGLGATFTLNLERLSAPA